jgi:CRISPR-associated protein Cmr2
VGVVKRLGEGRKSYASVTRIAADPWVRGLTDDVRKELSASAAKIKNLQRVEQETLKAFPYEGHVLYLNRHADLAKEAKLQPDELQPIKEILTKLMEPNPYLAVLVADGDKMGAAISKLEKAQNHREFSRALAGFASLAKQIVEQHHGVLVYAGGDDVLAFLPVDKCLCCARALRNKFIECLKTQVPNDTPTLSVGIAIGHFMENLEDLLEYGHEAEKAAKNVEGKDALAVHLHKRGGAPIKIAGKWGALDLQLDRYTQLFIDEALPAKFPYELRQLANVYDGWKDAVEVIQADVRRIIKKKRSKEGDTKQLQENLLTLIAQLTNSAAIRQVSEVLLVAKQIEENYTQANRRQVNDQ